MHHVAFIVSKSSLTLVLTAEQKEVELQIQRAGGFHRLEVAFPMYNLEAKRGVEKSP